ncbi:MAG TPA: GGDEF domain-containing protein [Terriglobales bacterium]|nr:GGDEF domain-containing protein [Terriglobales bacterium]
MSTNRVPVREEDQPSQSLLARLSGELARIEKRDWELWSIVLGTGIVVSVGLLILAFPSAFLSSGGQLHFEIYVSKEMFIGLVALLVLFNAYLVSKRLELRRVREKTITTTIQSELIKLQSFTDPLTEVYNRRSLDEMAARYISHARRTEKPLTFVLIDADHFKQINTRFGHLTGDFVIAEIASLLKNVVRGSDAVVRYGGDEFLMILADTTPEGASAVLTRLEKSLQEWNRAGHLPQFELRLSVGVGTWADGRTLDEILDEADHNMYSDKTSRK